jgi:G:T/U-mismatch repair DNA glycosylase
MRGRGILDAFKKTPKTMEQIEEEMYSKANKLNAVKTGVFDTLTAKMPETPEAYRNFVTTAQTARMANAARKTAGRRRLTRRRR